MKFLVGQVGSTPNQKPRVYVITDEQAIDLTSIDASIGYDLLNLIEQGDAVNRVNALTKGASSISVAGITPALPIASPGKTICLGLNYTDHIKEGGYAVPEYPALFMRGPNSLMAAGAP